MGAHFVSQKKILKFQQSENNCQNKSKAKKELWVVLTDQLA